MSQQEDKKQQIEEEKESIPTRVNRSDKQDTQARMLQGQMKQQIGLKSQENLLFLLEMETQEHVAQQEGSNHNQQTDIMAGLLEDSEVFNAISQLPKIEKQITYISKTKSVKKMTELKMTHDPSMNSIQYSPTQSFQQLQWPSVPKIQIQRNQTQDTILDLEQNLFQEFGSSRRVIQFQINPQQPSQTSEQEKPQPSQFHLSDQNFQQFDQPLQEKESAHFLIEQNSIFQQDKYNTFAMESGEMQIEIPIEEEKIQEEIEIDSPSLTTLPIQLPFSNKNRTKTTAPKKSHDLGYSFGPKQTFTQLTSHASQPVLLKENRFPKQQQVTLPLYTEHPDNSMITNSFNVGGDGITGRCLEWATKLEELIVQQGNETQRLAYKLLMKGLNGMVENQKNTDLEKLLLKFKEQDSILQTTQFTIHQKEDELDFLFLFSDALVAKKQTLEKIELRPIQIQIDYEKEQDCLEADLKSSKRQINFLAAVATKANFGRLMDKHPKYLHFCGHGTKNSEGDSLIFEDDCGASDQMACKDLDIFLNKTQPLEFVFVSSCHSEIVGQVFKDAGAKHVICVSREDKILEQSCLTFTESFYHAYFQGLSVCDAYQKAREQVRLENSVPKGEFQKFLILHDHQDGQLINECESYSCEPPGEFTNMGEKPMFNKVPAHVEHFIGRNLAMHYCITEIKKSRFLTIKGVPGIGKSSIAKEIAQFFIRRLHHFQDGVLYLDIKNCDQIEDVMSCMCNTIDPEQKSLKLRKEDKNQMLKELTHLYNSKKKVLIIMDNADLVINTDYPNFRFLISELLVNCFKLKILVTSQKIVGGGLQGITEKIYLVEPLDNISSVLLLYKRSSRQWDKNEENELLQTSQEMLQKSLIAWAFRNPQKKGQSQQKGIENHHFFKLLNGHPQAIGLVASLLESQSLQEVYYQTRNSMIDTLKVHGQSSDDTYTTSIKFSLDTSIKYLKKNHYDTVRFFAMFGLLPGGIQSDAIKSIWGNKWKEHKIILLSRSLLVQRTCKTHQNDSPSHKKKYHFQLVTFMTQYAEKLLEKQEWILFDSKIMRYLASQCEKYYCRIGVPQKHKGQNSLYYEEFLLDELNIRVALTRFLQEIDVVKEESSGGLDFSSIGSRSLWDRPKSIEKESWDGQLSIKSEIDEPLNGKMFMSENFDYLKSLGIKSSLQVSLNALQSGEFSEFFNSKLGVDEFKVPKEQSKNWNKNLVNIPEADPEQEQSRVNLFPGTNIVEEGSINLSANKLLNQSIKEPLEQDEKPSTQKPEQEEDDIRRQSTILEHKNLASKLSPPSGSNSSNDNVSDDCFPTRKKSKSLTTKDVKEKLKQNKQVHWDVTEVTEEESKEDESTQSNKQQVEQIDSKKGALKKAINRKLIKSVNSKKNQHTQFQKPQSKEKTRNQVDSDRIQSKFNKFYLPQNKHKKITKESSKLAIYYCTILILLRRYKCCETSLKHAFKCVHKSNDKKGQANLHRLKGCLFLIEKNYSQAMIEFQISLEQFKECGILLGITICQAAIGHCLYHNRDYESTRKIWESSLKRYKQLEHIFGQHYLHTWLEKVKSKIPKYKKDCSRHKRHAKRIISGREDDCAGSKHKGGIFYLRWYADKISIFLEVAFESDITPVQRKFQFHKDQGRVDEPLKQGQKPHNQHNQHNQQQPKKNISKFNPSKTENVRQTKKDTIVLKFKKSNIGKRKKIKKKTQKDNLVLSIDKGFSIPLALDDTLLRSQKKSDDKDQ